MRIANIITILVILLPGSLQVRATEGTFYSADNSAIRVLGRIDRSKQGVIRFDWPGIIIETGFEGTSCAITLGGSNEYYGVFIDSVFTHVVKTDSVIRSYPLAGHLADTLHTLRFVKRFETDRQVTECTGITLDSGRTLRPLPPKSRYFIEFIGASTILGYGNESKTTRCDSLAKVSNIHLSYGPVAARLCNADYTICAKTRAGLVRNYHSLFLTSKKTFPDYYRRTLLSDSLSKPWRYATPPDIIVITLGMNDYSTTPLPPRELFINHYFAFTRELYALYPDVHLVCVTSWREPLRSYVKTFVDSELSDGNKKITFFSYERMPDWERGCDWHPNAKAHEHIGEQLATVIRSILGEDAVTLTP